MHQPIQKSENAIKTTTMSAYSQKDVDFNMSIENDVNDLLDKTQETNNTMSHIYKILKLIEYNRSTILANIRCGMITNWTQILARTTKQYRDECMKFEKSLANCYSVGSRGNSVFMSYCFTMNDCYEIMDNVVKPIVETDKEYSEARSESLHNTPVHNDVVSEIMMY